MSDMALVLAATVMGNAMKNAIIIELVRHNKLDIAPAHLLAITQKAHDRAQVVCDSTILDVMSDPNLTFHDVLERLEKAVREAVRETIAAEFNKPSNRKPTAPEAVDPAIMALMKGIKF